MSFLAAPRLWLLLGVAALAVAYVVVQRRRRPAAVRFTNLALLDVVAPKRPGWRRHLPAAAFALALSSLVVAFARPARDERVPRERATVMMAIDVSVSMEATDVTPNRLAAAQAAAHSFVDQFPEQVNLGLVSFAGTARLLVPPSTDHEAVRLAINNLRLEQRTAIGEAVFLALDAIASLPAVPGEDPVPARIVLMSDGETTAGRPNDEAATAAQEAGVPVTTIAFGTDEGVVQAPSGATVPVPVNEGALEEVAVATGGSFFTAASGEELRDAYVGLGSSLGYVTEEREISPFFVGLGLAFAMAAAVGSLVWSSRLP